VDLACKYAEDTPEQKNKFLQAVIQEYFQASPDNFTQEAQNSAWTKWCLKIHDEFIDLLKSYVAVGKTEDDFIADKKLDALKNAISSQNAALKSKISPSKLKATFQVAKKRQQYQKQSTEAQKNSLKICWGIIYLRRLKNVHIVLT